MKRGAQGTLLIPVGHGLGAGGGGTKTVASAVGFGRKRLERS